MEMNSTRNCQSQTKHSIIDISNPEEVCKFNITQQTLANIVELNKHDSKLLHDENSSSIWFSEILNALQSDIHCGLKGDDIDDFCQRLKVFGSNHISQEENEYIPTRVKSFFGLPFKALKDPSFILLLCCVMLSLAIGIKRNGPQEGISYGFVLFISIFVFLNTRFICKHFKAKWFARKHTVEDSLKVEVLRDGEVQQIGVHKIVVGDILCLHAGEQVPVDGLFIDGKSLKLDDNSDRERFKSHKHPSIFLGEKVVQGYCRMLVTAVGDNTERIKLRRSLTMLSSNESFKLQTDINKLNSNLQKIMLSLSLFVLIIQFLRCFVWKSRCDDNHNPDPKGVKSTVEEIMTEGTKIIRKKGMPVNRLVSMLCVLIFSLRDGLPLGIFISLAYASKQIMSHGLMVQELEACATIGLINTICMDITNDLIIKPPKIAELWVGFERVGDPIESIPLKLLTIFREVVRLSMYHFEEFALSFWAEQVLGIKKEEVKANCRIMSIEGLDHKKTLIGFSIIRNGEDKKCIRIYWRGVSNKILSMCSHFYKVDGTLQVLDKETLTRFGKMIEEYGSSSLQCLAFAYRKVSVQEKEETIETYIAPQHGLTLLGLIFLKNPYSNEMIGEIKFCNDLGVKIKLMVDDNVEKSRFMAINSGILELDDDKKSTHGTVVEAFDFRACSKEEKTSILEKFQVMASCTPCDRLRVVQGLRGKGEVVAAIVKSSRDSVTLKQADLGFFGGENEFGKGESDILLPRMNFSEISSLLKLGACVYNNIQKFIQLQLTINISAFVINSILVLLSSEVPLGPFELLWVNMVMDFFGAIALGEIEESPQLNHIQKPRSCLITKSMWANIVFQSFYQVIVLLTFNFWGKRILKMDQNIIEVMVFNFFMIFQVFGMINARGIERGNTFKVIARKRGLMFIACIVVIFVLQIVAIEAMSMVHQFARLRITHWCICIGVGAIALPIGWFVQWVCIICNFN